MINKKKICLDAGHYGKYNRSPAVKEYYESEAMWKLHLLQKKYLEQYGFEVILTRNKQETDKDLYNRGAMSKGCDLFISNHSNATGAKVNESTDYPVVIVPLNGQGDKLGKKLADCICNVMETKQKGRIMTRKGNNGEYYGVIRGAVAVGTVGMILEHSFHDHAKSAKWLLNAANLDKLAKAEAAVIAEHFGMDKAEETAKEPTKETFKPYLVKITASSLNVRHGAGTKYKVVTSVKKNEVFTIVEEKKNSSTLWGRLKSGVGWISLQYTKKI